MYSVVKMLQVKLFLVFLLGCVFTTNAFRDKLNISQTMDRNKDEKAKDIVVATFFSNKTVPQRAGAGEERELKGFTDITGLDKYKYVVPVLHKTGLMITGVLINEFWVVINPVNLILANYNYEEELRVNPDNVLVYSGQVTPVTSGFEHKVKDYRAILSSEKFNSYDTIGLVRICPGLKLDVYPTIPSSPIGVDVSGDIISWQDKNTLGTVTKLSAADSDYCSGLKAFNFMDSDTSKMFCTKSDSTQAVTAMSSDSTGSPFIASGDLFFGLLLYFDTYGTEIFVDLPYYKIEIENLAPNYTS